MDGPGPGWIRRSHVMARRFSPGRIWTRSKESNGCAGSAVPNLPEIRQFVPELWGNLRDRGEKRAALRYQKRQAARVCASLVRIVVPAKAGCAQIGLSASVYSR